MSAEDPAALRTARVSPAHQRNGHDDRTDSISRTEETRGSTRRTHLEHLNTGPTSRAVRDSISNPPFFDSMGVDNDYNTGRNQASRTKHGSKEQAMLRCSPGFGSELEQFLGKMQCRESPSSSREALNMSHELNQTPKRSRKKIDPSQALNTTREPVSLTREWQSSSPSPVPNMMSMRSVFTNPPSKTASHSEQNGYTPPFFNDGRASPMLGQTARSHKLLKAQRHAGLQDAPSPNLSRPVVSRAERMAALERRMRANGLSTPGRSRAGLGQKGSGQDGVSHVGAVQMNEGSNTSGSESSESEVENKGGASGSPVTFSNPVERNSPIPRNKLSLGSLQLDEEADEDGSHGFSDDDVGQIFSC